MIHIGYSRVYKPRVAVCRYALADYHTQSHQPLRDTRLHPALDMRGMASLGSLSKSVDKHGSTHRDL
jgi:hypothetical protein